MQKDLIITYKDEIKCSVQGLDDYDKSIISKKFKFFNPTARFSPKYKLGIWDGYISFFSLTGLTYVNLLPKIFNAIDIKKYNLIVNTNGYGKTFNFEQIDEDFLSDYTWDNENRLSGQKIKLLPHQIDIVNKCLTNQKSLINSSTGSGKTLVAACLSKIVSKQGRIIIIEPRADIAVNTENEFKKLGIDVGIVGLGRRDVDKPVMICMWQTLNSITKSSKSKKEITEKLNYEDVLKIKKDLIAILFDEVHTATANEVQKLCNDVFADIPIRWGLTGTIPKKQLDEVSLFVSFGEIAITVKANELQKKKLLANCNINCIKIYTDVPKSAYPQEIKMVESDESRLNFLVDFITNIVKTTGNTLVLANHIKYGQKINEALLKNDCDSIFLSGADKVIKRFEEYKSINNSNNKCIVANPQIASTGIDIPRLFNLVTIDIGKSFQRTIQSVGRSIRLAADKDFATIYDITSSSFHLNKHLNDRIKYYAEEKYPYKIFNIKNLKD